MNTEDEYLHTLAHAKLEALLGWVEIPEASRDIIVDVLRERAIALGLITPAGKAYRAAADMLEVSPMGASPEVVDICRRNLDAAVSASVAFGETFKDSMLDADAAKDSGVNVATHLKLVPNPKPEKPS